MTVSVPGGTISHNVRRITAIAWTAAEVATGFGELVVTLKLNETLYRVFDPQFYADQASYFNATTPDTWIIRMDIDEAVDIIWADPPTNSIFTLLRTGFGITSAILPSNAGRVVRVTDKRVEVDITPQAQGTMTATDSTMYNFVSTSSSSYFTKTNGAPLGAAIQPGDGVIRNRNYHAHRVSTGTQVQADPGGEYRRTVAGTPNVDLVAGHGYSTGDTIGRTFEVIAKLGSTRFDKRTLDVSNVGFADPTGETLEIEIGSNASTYIAATHTGVSSDDQDLLDGVIAGELPTAGDRFGYTVTDNADLTADIEYEAGFASVTTINKTANVASIASSGQIANPYGGDFTLGTGFCLKDPAYTFTIRDEDGNTIATFTDIASKLQGFGDYYEVSSTPVAGVYITGDVDEAISQEFNVLVLDPLYHTSSINIVVHVDNPNTEV